MSRIILLLSLLAVASPAFAAEVSETEGVAPADEAQATTDEEATTIAGAAQAEAEPEAEPEAQAEGGAKLISGMSILGNQEAPKSLVIVPWKSSVIGDSVGISTMLDDSRQPVDREVFLRALTYYEIRSETGR
jgi:hypothetical protein